MAKTEEFKSYYLTHASVDFCLGLHSIVYYTKKGRPASSQSWLNFYNKNHEFVQLAYRVRGSIETELSQFLSEGWQVIPAELFETTSH